MISRLSPAQRGLIITALGSSLTVSWASSYYIPAVLAMVGPWATLFGWFFWCERHDAMTVIGAAIIVASGVFTILHEKRHGTLET